MENEHEQELPAAQPSQSCTLSLQCVKGYLRDKVACRTAKSEVEYVVISATQQDIHPPDNAFTEQLIAKTLTPKVSEIVEVLARRIASRSPPITMKSLIVTHRLITTCDTHFIYALQQFGEKQYFDVAALHAKEFQTCPVFGTYLGHIVETYCAYLKALGDLVSTMVRCTGRNLLKERCLNTYLSNITFTAEFADIVRQCCELISVIASLRIGSAILGSALVRCVVEAFITDAKCFYIFCVKVIERALYEQAAITDIASARKWLRVHQTFSSSTHLLSSFFSHIVSINNKQLNLSVPTLHVPPPSATAAVRAALDELQPPADPATPASPRTEDVPIWQVRETLNESMRKSSMMSLHARPVTIERPHIPTPASPSGPPKVLGKAATALDLPQDKSKYLDEIPILTNVTNSLMSTQGNSDDLQSTATNLVSVDSSTLDRSELTSSQDTRFVVFADEVLGRGSYGTVFKAWDEHEGRHVACKQINRGSSSGVSASLRSEFDTLIGLQHPHIVSVFAFEPTETGGRIVMEWIPGGSVQGIIQRTNHGLKESVIKRYLMDALKALVFVHERKIVHRDIKPGNMLLDATGRVKLTDFGTSRLMQLDDAPASLVATQSIVGTIPYLAPENFQGVYCCASDVWSLGATAVHMYTGSVPWAEVGARDSLMLAMNIGSRRPPNHMPAFSPECPFFSEIAPPSAEFRDFLTQCFCYNHSERPTAAELMRHAFFAAEQ